MELALFVRRDLAGDEALEGRAGDAPKTIDDREGEHHPGRRRGRVEKKAEAVKPEPGVDAPDLPELRNDDPDQPALDHPDGKSDHRDRETHHPLVPLELFDGVVGPIALDRMGGDLEQHERRHQAEDDGIAPEVGERGDRVGPFPLERAAIFRRQGLRQDKVTVEPVDQHQDCRGDEGDPGSVGSEEPAHQRAQNEAHSEDRPNHAKILGSFFRR